jgi:hypothetical protein
MYIHTHLEARVALTDAAVFDIIGAVDAVSCVVREHILVRKLPV